MDDTQVRAMKVDLDAITELIRLLKNSWNDTSDTSCDNRIWDKSAIIELARTRSPSHVRDDMRSYAFHDWIGVIQGTILGGRPTFSRLLDIRLLAEAVYDLDESIELAAIESTY